MSDTKELTLGEERVGLNFNPANDPTVTQIKTAVAALIDLCESLKAKNPRLAATAQTQFEGASMWAVKLATFKGAVAPETPTAPVTGGESNTTAPENANAPTGQGVTPGAAQ